MICKTKKKTTIKFSNEEMSALKTVYNLLNAVDDNLSGGSCGNDRYAIYGEEDDVYGTVEITDIDMFNLMGAIDRLMNIDDIWVGEDK